MWCIVFHHVNSSSLRRLRDLAVRPKAKRITGKTYHSIFHYSLPMVDLLSNMLFSEIGILACDTLCKPTLYSHNNRLLVFNFD